MTRRAQSTKAKRASWRSGSRARRACSSAPPRRSISPPRFRSRKSLAPARPSRRLPWTPDSSTSPAICSSDRPRPRQRRSLDKEHLPVRRERPEFVRHFDLELVARLTQGRHRRDDLVAVVLRVLLGRPVAFVGELVFELVGPTLEVVDLLRQEAEQLLAFRRRRAGRLHRG